jgi:hypothetical protein
MRAIGIISVTPTARQRRWWAALAIVALAMLSLRPACEAWLSHWSMGNGGQHAAAVHGHVHSAPAQSPHEEACCGSIEAYALVKPADMLPGQTAKTPSVAILQSLRAAFPAATPLLHALTASVIPPGNPPFYVRSTRILR